jgi:hypothetical protein
LVGDDRENDAAQDANQRDKIPSPMVMSYSLVEKWWQSVALQLEVQVFNRQALSKLAFANRQH